MARAEYLKELDKIQAAVAVAVAFSSSRSASAGGGNDDEYDMVGFSDLFLQIRDLIIAEDRVTGMEGIGKTTFVKKSVHLSLLKAGKTIAENCEGLPLLILTVAQLTRNSGTR